MALELRGVRLRRAFDRKKVEGCARDAMRRIEVDDIGMRGCLVVLVRIFGELLLQFVRFSRSGQGDRTNRTCSNWLRHVAILLAECRSRKQE